MVEAVTDNAIRDSMKNLCDRDLLTAELRAEIESLTGEMAAFSNWTEAGAHFRSKGMTRLAGYGPMSKFLRTLAYTLERLEVESGRHAAEGLRIGKILILEATSGCSDYRGAIRVIARKDDGSEIPLVEGRFVWDCAAQGMPQPEAAQRLGYRCMTSFPALSEVSGALR